ERHRAGLWKRAHQFYELLHRQSTPFGNAAPALDTVVHCYMFGGAEFLQLRKGEFDGMLNQPTHFEAKIAEAVLCHALPIVANGHLAIGPEVRRDIFFAVLLLRNKPVQRE